MGQGIRLFKNESMIECQGLHFTKLNGERDKYNKQPLQECRPVTTGPTSMRESE